MHGTSYARNIDAKALSKASVRRFRIFGILLALVCGHAGAAANAGPETPPTGAFTVTYTTAELLGDDAARVEPVIPQDEPITWEIYVPPGYRQEAPAGLFVYVSPMPSGKLPGKWRRVMDERNLIWIGANRSGNRVVVGRRMLFAVLAILVAEQGYAVDTRRFYVSGFSGGGKVASRLATAHAQIFTGGFFIGGVEVWQDEQPDDIETMRSNRYVFLCGSNDQALRSCRQASRAYNAAGVEATELMIIRGMGHDTPDTSDFEKAIIFLDSSGDGTD